MNDNQYGLSSGVYTSDLARGMRVSKAIRAGITLLILTDSFLLQLLLEE